MKRRCGGAMVRGKADLEWDCIESKGVEADVPIEDSPESLAAGVDKQPQAAFDLVNAL